MLFALAQGASPLGGGNVVFIYTLREPRRGHSRLIGHEGCSWCVLMRLVVYVGLCVGLSGAVCGPWQEPDGPWEVLARRWRVLRWFLDVLGRVFGGSLSSIALEFRTVSIYTLTVPNFLPITTTK